MNVVWMVALGLVMTAEKLMLTSRFSRLIGIAFLLIGAAFILTSTLAHWPRGS
jgi:predicted metal-binding membrane protein